MGIIRKNKKDKKKKTGIVDKIRESPINYYSDLFVSVMVVGWIVHIVHMSVMADTVTIASINLSYRVGYDCINTSMWDTLTNCVTTPLSIGGGAWMIKCSVQHFLANRDGKQAHMDFPPVPDTEIEYEQEIKTEPEAGTEDHANEEDGRG